MVHLMIIDHLAVDEPGGPTMREPSAPFEPEAAIRRMMPAATGRPARPDDTAGAGIMAALGDKAGKGWRVRLEHSAG